MQAPSRTACPNRAALTYNLPLLGLISVSGCAALIYEVVWFQLLEFVIGSSAISIGVLLATFMGGLCVGSILLPRLVSAGRNPLLVWSALEAGIGVLGLVMLWSVPSLGHFYAAKAVHGLPSILLRATLCAGCILVPTLLMGATLPAASRVVKRGPAAISSVGMLYSGNTLGAVGGALLAGFYLLRVYDLPTATYVAVAMNELIALGLLVLSQRAPESAAASGARGFDSDGRDPLRHVYTVIALSGFCALSAEAIWTRVLALILGPTVYALAIVLAVFLAGLAIGSGAGSRIARRAGDAQRALGYCQLLLLAAIAWGACIQAKSLPFWPINPALERSVWIVFQIDVLRCAWAILPATVLWGATFPLALAAAKFSGDIGRLVGRVYAANTIGAILGALGASLLLVPGIGTQQSQRLLIGISAVASLLAFASAAGRGRNAAQFAGILSSWVASTFRPVAVIVLAGLLAWSVPKLPWGLIAYGRYLPTKTELGVPLYVGEGRDASVAVTELSEGVRNFHVSGKVEASTHIRDMRLQRMLAHVPGLLHPEPRSVLVVGCGAGVTAGSFLVHPSIERVVVCEIEPLVPKAVAPFFAVANHNLLNDPRVEVVYDDARHYLLTARENFDVITSDPIHPWVKGAATLYTKEYFQLCGRHLKDGGMITQWVPLYESNLAVVKSEVATFFDAFPHGTIWSNDDLGEGYDVVLLGQEEPLRIDIAALQQRLGSPEHEALAKSLREVGIKSAFALTATYAGQARDLRPWLKDAAINFDRNLRLQYLGGLGLNFHESELIFDDLLVFRRFPTEIFVGTNAWNEALRQSMEKSKPQPPKATQNHLPTK